MTDRVAHSRALRQKGTGGRQHSELLATLTSEEMYEDDDGLPWVRPTPQAYQAFFDRLVEVRHAIVRDALVSENPEKARRLLQGVISARPKGPPMGEGAQPLDVVASSSLSGGQHPCGAEECRVRCAHAGARFAALYSDQIWIRDPFENVVSHSYVDDEEFNLAAIGSMAVAFEWRALMEAGIASHIRPLCPHCLAREVAERDVPLPKSVSDLHEELSRELEASSEVAVYRDDLDGHLHIAYSLQPRFTGHKQLDVELTNPPAVKKYSRFLGKRTRRKVSKADAAKLDVFADVRGPIMDEAFMEALYRARCGASYASNLPIDLEIATRSEASDVHPSARLLKALKHSVPIVGNVPLDVILQVRMEEATAFELYRNRIAAVRRQVNDEAGLREAAEQLRGEFAVLERKIAARQSAFRGHVGGHAKLLAVTVMVGAATWLTGAAGLGLSTLFAGAGGLPALGELAGKALGIGKPTADEAEHPLYFLWKVKKAGQRKL